MSYEVGKKALDFLIANSGNRHNLEVDFFGRRAVDELAGCEGSGCIWKRAGENHDKHFLLHGHYKWGSSE